MRIFRRPVLSIVLLGAMAGPLLVTSARAIQFSVGGEGPALCIKLRVHCGRATGPEVPVSVPIPLPGTLAGSELSVTMRPEQGQPVPGQVVRHPKGRARLWWILPQAQPGQTQSWTALLKPSAPDAESFGLQDQPGQHLDVLFGDRPVLRCMYANDTSTSERAHETYKVYHHVYDLAGDDFITKGAGGKYTHHRGIFYGFMKLHYDGNKKDFWHMGGCRQEHEKFLTRVSGPVLARTTNEIHWNETGGRTVAVERRTLTAYRQPEPTITLLDFESTLEPNGFNLVLDGDPEHGGMQFRAHNQVAAETSGQTAYVFPEEDTNVREARDLPWAAMSYVVRDNRYGVQHVNHPDNPRDTRYSAYRNYGRFGAFFRKELPKDETLTVRYRLWIIRGDLPGRAEMAARREAFANPPRVEVVR